MEKWLLEKFARFALAAAVCAVAPLHVTSAGDPPADKPGAARLESSGTRLVIPDLHGRTLSVRPATANALVGATKAPSLAVSADLPYALSANGKVLAGLRKVSGDGAMELVVFDVETAARVGGFTLAANELPDGVWVNSKGTAAGVFTQGRFVAYRLDGTAPPSKPLFERSTSFFFGIAERPFDHSGTAHTMPSGVATTRRVTVSKSRVVVSEPLHSERFHQPDVDEATRGSLSPLPACPTRTTKRRRIMPGWPASL